ncbi:MAG: 2-isopropylmalate synthase [Thermoanaerobaculia bacterium]|nr:2-isopropylmalate synthase [Thermoanaerobaculia bacterium]
MHPAESDLIYDWNKAGGAVFPARGKVELDDETLRDGLQSPSVKSPSIDKKLQILHLMEAIGIDSVDIGLPGAGPHVVATVTRLAREIVDSGMKIRPNCAARTVAADIVPIIEISQKVGLPIEVACFIGSSPIRQYAEDWDLDRMLRMSEEAVSLAVREGLPVMYVTEDTTRANPEHIRKMYTTAIRAGAHRICVCDTVGHATPNGVRNLIRFVCELVDEVNPEVKVDWHGHQDRGLGVTNALWALEAGAHRVHACGLGIGERVGNTPMDQLLVNLRLLGWIDKDLTKLHEYCSVISEATGVRIPDNYPVVGRDAFRTGTGVHAAAIIKARKKGDDWLADRVYSGVPAAMVGRRQAIEVGPMSGLSNVQCWLEDHGIEPRTELVEAIFRRAKESDHILPDEEILAVVHGFAPAVV